jgi:signal transduction histidine kinase
MNWIPKDPLAKIDIKYKLPLGFVCLYLFVFAIGGYFVINSVYAPLNQEILLRLQSESLAQATIFDKKLEMLARRAEDFSSDGFIRTQTEGLVSQSGDVRSISQLRQHLLVNKLPLVDEFVDLQIFDLNGDKVVGVVDSTHSIQGYIQAGLQQENQQFSSIIVPGPVAKFPSTAIITPLWDIEMSRQIGYLVCVVNLISVINNTAIDYAEGISEARMEKYLSFVDQKGVALEVPWWYLKRLQPASGERGREEGVGVKVIPARSGLKPALHVGRHACQNGKDMLGESYPLNSAGWSTLIELDAHAALRPLSILEGKLLGVALAVALTTLVLLFFPIQYVVKPLGELQRMALRVKDGDFSVRNRIDSQDEFGHLARTFNMMTEAIEERIRRLEQTAADLQKREGELRIQHDRMQAVVHSMRDGLILLSHRGEIALSNAAAEPIIEKLNHVTEKEIVRKCELHPSADRDCVHCLLDTGRTTSCELSLNDRIYEVISSQLPSSNGAAGKVLVARDITERERMNGQQAHQERLAVLGRSAAVVAHEMNNPLAAISMYNQMMRDELPQDSSFHEHVKVISRNTQTCRRIIQELLDYARTPQPEAGEVDLLAIVRDAIRLLSPLHNRRGIAVEQHVETSNVLMWGDATHLQQVFVNLLDNAMQAIVADEGRISVTIGELSSREQLFVDIVDNGPGIAPGAEAEIFEPFFTTKSSGGTGLGLPTAKRIIDVHGGDLLLLKSKNGETIFRVILPRQNQQKTKVQAPKSETRRE